MFRLSLTNLMTAVSSAADRGGRLLDCLENIVTDITCCAFSPHPGLHQSGIQRGQSFLHWLVDN